MKYSLLFSSFFSVLVGMGIYKYDLPPRPQLHFLKCYVNDLFESHGNNSKRIVEITRFKENETIYLDRNYTNKFKSSLFDKCFLIKLPRHNQNNIDLFLEESCIIYRFVSLRNDNKFYSDWQKLYIPINISAISCNHNYVVSKEFPKGFVSLPSGGPYASDPILIQAKENINWQKLFRLENVSVQKGYY